MYLNMGITTKQNKTERRQNVTKSISEAEKVVDHWCNRFKSVMKYNKNCNKAFAINAVKELIQDGFEYDELLDMIDFVYLSDQTLIDKEKFGMGSFKVDRYVEYIDDNLQSYLDGKPLADTPKYGGSSANAGKKFNRQREWNPNVSGRIQFGLSDYD